MGVPGEMDAPGPSRRCTRGARLRRAVLASLLGVGLVGFMSRPAAASGDIYDRQWVCDRGGITVNFPLVFSADREGFWLQPVIFKLVNGQWQPVATNTFGALVASNGVQSLYPYEGWIDQTTGYGARNYSVSGLSSGEYAVAMVYRFETVPTNGNFLSTVYPSGAGTCVIPK